MTARMGHLGLGAREDMLLQEERSRREVEAYYAAYVRGQGMRVGFVFWIYD